jgi:hypothetical protein
VSTPPDKITPRDHAFDDEAPPIMGTWGKIYASIIVYLIALIIAFSVFTAVFNR